MKIIISPAKKMKMDLDGLEYCGLPLYLDKANQLKQQLCKMSDAELKNLWRCSDKLVKLNKERFRTMDLQRRLTPAVFAYEGIQYQYMAPDVFTCDQLDYVQKRVFILSGFYGILRPFDGITPYRLEMQARLQGNGFRSLYEFWGDALAKRASAETDTIINLASREYSKAVSVYLPKEIRFLTCTFGEVQNGRLVEKGVRCKMARGEMVRFMAENNIEDAELLKNFCRLHYVFSLEHSTETNYVFIRKKKLSEPDTERNF